MESYDVVVIGSGPAGEKGAEQAAQFGKRVALIERAEHLGGAGINTGTVPSKTLRETALYFSGLQQRGLYGIDYSLRAGLSVRELMHREHVVVGNERRIISRDIRQLNVTVYRGTAALQDPHVVHIAGPAGPTEIAGDIILLATGSSPFRPPDIPFDRRLIHDSDTVLDMKSIPRSLVIVGAGAVGVEYACIFAALDAKVTLLEEHDHIMPFVDSEIIQRLLDQLRTIGVKVMLNSRVTRLRTEAKRVRLDMEDGSTGTFDMALITVGRRSNVEGLGLEHIGVKTGERGRIEVNEHYQTSVPNVYAAGDVIGFPALAAASMEQARVAMTHALGEGHEERVSPVLPLAVYAIPEISMVGLTEDECKTRKVPYLVGRGLYEDNARGQIIGDVSGMIKLVFSPSDRRVLGAHIIGELAAELIHIAAHVMMSGQTIDEFVRAVYNYPTLADVYKAAAHDGLRQLERAAASQP
jgi:NAD(P) transhydrogenase